MINFKYLFSIIFLLVIFFESSPVLAAQGCPPIPDCPSDYTYNSSTKICEAAPLCPVDPNMNVCLTDPTFTCSSDYSWNPEAFRCEAEPICNCPSASLVKEDCSVYCEESGSPPCACEGYTGLDENGQAACLKVPDCPDSGGLFAPIVCTRLCMSTVSISCASGYVYQATIHMCVMNPPKCPNGGSFSSFYDKCTASPYPCEKDNECSLNDGQGGNVASGTAIASENEFSLNGTMSVNFTRYHDTKTSQTSLIRGFGRTWGHNYDTRVMTFGVNLYKVIEPNGFVIYYNDTNGDKVYEPDIPKGVTSSLVKNPDNTFKRVHKDGSKEEYNASGYLTAVVDRNGNRLNLTRDIYNKLITITDPPGRVINLAYSGNYISQITLPDGKTITYTYVSGVLQKVTYPDGSQRLYEYNNYKLTGIKNEKGNYIEKHTYDASNRATTSSADGTNNKLTISYTSETQSTVTDSLGRVTTYTYNSGKGRNYPISISGPGCKECGQGNVSYTYDDNLNVTSTTDANGNITTMTYDANGNMLTKTEAYGTPIQRTTTFTYNTFGQPLTVTDPEGNTTAYTYDEKGNLLATTDAAGNATSLTYNTAGLMTSMTDPQGNVTTYAYDQYGNLATVTDPLGHTTTNTYDVMGKLLTMTDANGNQTTYTYDQRGRLTQVTDSLNQVTTYTYDPAGNLTAITDAKGNATQFAYDSINRLIRETNALGNQRTYTYNTVSNLTNKTDAKGSASTYTYDDYNRLTAITYPGGTQTTFGYDNTDNITAAANPNISYTLNYDALKRKTSVADSLNRSLEYAYDANSNRTSMTDPTGTTTYLYDALNRLTSLTDPANKTYAFAYDTVGRRTGITLPNGITTNYTYDNVSRLLSIINGTVSTNSYAYDNIGNRTSMTTAAGTHNYAYDAIYRLAQATHPTPPAEQFTYDPVGNRQTDGVGHSYFYNNANRLLNYNGVTYQYDANGNATSRVDACGTTTYTWDYENRITDISGFSPDCSALSASYKYDPFGRRIEKVVNGEATRYLYDEEDILLEYDGNNQIVARYTHGPGIDEPLSLEKNGQKYYYHLDGLSSVTGITNATGDVVQRYEYDSFGNIASMSDPNFVQPYTYTSREYDPESGLYFYRARYYDAKAGRFISEDPIMFEGDSPNFYSYVGNNPMIWVDPEGLKWKHIGPRWYHWVLEVDQCDLDVIKDELEKSGVALIPHLDPLTWPFEYYYKKEREKEKKKIIQSFLLRL